MTTFTPKQKRKKLSGTQIRLNIDVVLFIGMVWALMPQTTGIPLHEWGSLLIIGPLLMHLILNWQWIMAITNRLFKRQPGQSRFNYFWDWFLFAMTVIAIFSGIVISEVALPTMGIPIVVDPFWVEVHLFSANSVMIMIGVHLAMHWRWIVANTRRYILRPLTRANGGAA
jgi:hypothetical protein